MTSPACRSRWTNLPHLSSASCESTIYVYTSILGMSADAVLHLGWPCATLRRASRALTQTYEQEMREHGLRASQFTILQVLSRAGEIKQGTLGDMLAMDSTTLTRTLRVMARSGWIAQRTGKDRRERLVRLSSNGTKKMQETLHAWNHSQADLRHKLRANNWEQLETLLNQIVDITTRSGDL